MVYSFSQSHFLSLSFHKLLSIVTYQRYFTHCPIHCHSFIFFNASFQQTFIEYVLNISKWLGQISFLFLFFMLHLPPFWNSFNISNKKSSLFISLLLIYTNFYPMKLICIICIQHAVHLAKCSIYITLRFTTTKQDRYIIIPIS